MVLDKPESLADLDYSPTATFLRLKQSAFFEEAAPAANAAGPPPFVSQRTLHIAYRERIARLSVFSNKAYR